MNAALTIREMLQEAKSKLHNSGSARLDAEVLLCNVLEVDRNKLYSAPETIIPANAVSLYRSLVQDRKQGRPVAYLTGTREFWSLEFQVNEHTLVPRPETERLVETALEHIPANVKLAIADLGTGSGAIAIAIARERPCCAITATDICERALAVAAANAGRLAVNNVKFVKSDWYANLQGSFDIIVSNPPYIRNDDEHLQGEGVAYEPGTALCGGVDGLDAIRSIISNATRYLKPDGRLFIEHGYDQAQAVRSLFEKFHFTDIQSKLDYASVERVTSGKRQHE
jgi:release factor glutamine methyltransferase